MGPLSVHFGDKTHPRLAFGQFDFIINPILDNSYYGGIKSLDFAPASRVAYNVNEKWAVAVEHYADFGKLRDILPIGEQFHQIWGVFDHGTKYGDFEAGIGFGLNDASDRVTLKLMWSKDLNAKNK